MFGEILQKFAEKSPATVMVRTLLEHLLNADRLDRWFETARQKQYTRDILFSSLVGLLLQVVCKTQASVHAAYRGLGSGLDLCLPPIPPCTNGPGENARGPD